MYRAYIIQDPTGRMYIGVSENVAKRLGQHNNGESRWTSGKGPWNLIWTSDELPLGAARKLENQLKRQKGGAGLRKLMEMKGGS